MPTISQLKRFKQIALQTSNQKDSDRLGNLIADVEFTGHDLTAHQMLSIAEQEKIETDLIIAKLKNRIKIQEKSFDKDDPNNKELKTLSDSDYERLKTSALEEINWCKQYLPKMLTAHEIADILSENVKVDYSDKSNKKFAQMYMRENYDQNQYQGQVVNQAFDQLAAKHQ